MDYDNEYEEYESDTHHCFGCGEDYDSEEINWVWTTYYGNRVQVPGDCPTCGEDADWGDAGGSAEEHRAERRQMGLCNF